MYVRIAPSDDAAAAELNGAGVVVTIPIESTGGEVLVVPIAALTARADGSTWIEVLDGAQRRDVPVEVGLQADGLVEVSPAGGADLAEGDRVVVGEPDESQQDDSQETGSGDA